MDNNTGYQGDKYNVTRKDGKPVGRVFVIELDKDPDASKVCRALGDVYWPNRRLLSSGLHGIAKNLESRNGDVR